MFGPCWGWPCCRRHWVRRNRRRAQSSLGQTGRAADPAGKRRICTGEAMPKGVHRLRCEIRTIRPRSSASKSKLPTPWPRCWHAGWAFHCGAEFVQYEWDTLLPGLVKGDFDVILNGYEITPDRAGKMLFTRPYYVYAQQLVVRADEKRIQSLADCTDLAVGTMAGTAAERFLKAIVDCRRRRFWWPGRTVSRSWSWAGSMPCSWTRRSSPITPLRIRS